MGALTAIFYRDLALALRSGGGVAQTLIFFALVIVLFAFSVGPNPEIQRPIAAPILWTAVLLSSIMSLDRMFQADYEDGNLDILVQRTPTLALLFLVKAAAHWTSACAPLIVASPVFAIMLNLAPEQYGTLVASLIVGTPALSLFGALGAALVFPIRRASVLLTLIIGPMFAPIIIFGVAAATGGSNPPELLFLMAISLMALIVAPIAGGAAIRFNLD